MHHCRYCGVIVDYDPGSDLWRGRDSGKLECRAHTERNLYRFLHEDKAIKEIKPNVNVEVA